MKKVISIFFLLWAQSMLLAQNSNTWVQDIRSKYKQIRENLSNYEETVVEIMNESTEGGYATAFADKTSIKLIEVGLAGEMGKQITAYYFDEDKLIFAFDQMFHYNVPFYLDKERAEEMGLKEYYDPKKTRIEEQRYYFSDEKLFRYLDKDKKEVDLSIKANMKIGEAIRKEAQKMKAVFEDE